MFIESLLQIHGYILIFIGTILEGETVLIIAGFLAHQEYLSLPMVMLVAFIGSFTGDQIYFWFGRIKGKKILQKYPIIGQRVELVSGYMEKYGKSFMIAFRFIFGIRTIAPIIFGTGKIKARTFILFNLAGAIIWTILMGSIGYLFGEAAKLIFGKIEHIEKYLIILILIVIATIWVYKFTKNRINNRKH